MSSRGSRVSSQRGNTRNTRSRKNVLNVDLNALPRENRDHEGTSAHTNSQDVPGVHQGGSSQPTLIDVDAFDDDVFISSPRAFAEAKNNNSRRNRPDRPVVVDVEAEERTDVGAAVTRPNKRRKLRSNEELYILEGSSDAVILDQPVRPPPPLEMKFKCPVCLGQLVDATSTKCGHIFCKGCLKTALAAQSKCPTCRKRSVLKDTIRIYLPATT